MAGVQWQLTENELALLGAEKISMSYSEPLVSEPTLK
jgi:hypothetical protein